MGNSLLSAARDGNLEKVEKILEDPKNNINFQDDEHGVTALMEAASYGHYAVVSFLIDKKANVNTLSKHGVPAVIYAAAKNHYDIVELLAFHGASNKQLSHINKSIIYDRVGVEKAFATGATRRQALHGEGAIEGSFVSSTDPLSTTEHKAGAFTTTTTASTTAPTTATNTEADATRAPSFIPLSGSSSSTATTSTADHTSSSSSNTHSSLFEGFLTKARTVLAPKNNEGGSAQHVQSTPSAGPAADQTEVSSAAAALRGEVEKLKAFLASGGGLNADELEEKEREVQHERNKVKQLQQDNQRLEEQVQQLMALKQRGGSLVDEPPPAWLEEKIQLLRKTQELTIQVEDLKRDLTKARLEAQSWKSVLDSYVNDAPGDDVDAGRESVDAGRPSVDAGRPNVDAGRPSVNGVRASVDANRASVDGAGAVGARTSVNGGRASVDAGRPSVSGAGASVDGRASVGGGVAERRGSETEARELEQAADTEKSKPTDTHHDISKSRGDQEDAQTANDSEPKPKESDNAPESKQESATELQKESSEASSQENSVEPQEIAQAETSTSGHNIQTAAESERETYNETHEDKQDEAGLKERNSSMQQGTDAAKTKSESSDDSFFFHTESKPDAVPDQTSTPEDSVPAVMFHTGSSESEPATSNPFGDASNPFGDLNDTPSSTLGETSASSHADTDILSEFFSEAAAPQPAVQAQEPINPFEPKTPSAEPSS